MHLLLCLAHTVILDSLQLLQNNLFCFLFIPVHNLNKKCFQCQLANNLWTSSFNSWLEKLEVLHSCLFPTLWFFFFSLFLLCIFPGKAILGVGASVLTDQFIVLSLLWQENAVTSAPLASPQTHWDPFVLVSTRVNKIFSFHIVPATGILPLHLFILCERGACSDS